MVVRTSRHDFENEPGWGWWGRADSTSRRPQHRVELRKILCLQGFSGFPPWVNSLLVSSPESRGRSLELCFPGIILFSVRKTGTFFLQLLLSSADVSRLTSEPSITWGLVGQAHKCMRIAKGYSTKCPFKSVPQPHWNRRRCQMLFTDEMAIWRFGMRLTPSV